MEIEKLDAKDEYSGEETLEIIRETLHQLGRELDDDLFELKEKIDKENDSLLKAGLKRSKYQLQDDRAKVQDYFGETGTKWLTECCDAPIQRYALNTRGQCSECKRDDPETYQEETTIQDFIKFLNNKIDEENQK